MQVQSLRRLHLVMHTCNHTHRTWPDASTAHLRTALLEGHPPQFFALLRLSSSNPVAVTNLRTTADRSPPAGKGCTGVVRPATIEDDEFPLQSCGIYAPRLQLTSQPGLSMCFAITCCLMSSPLLITVSSRRRTIAGSSKWLPDKSGSFTSTTGSAFFAFLPFIDCQKGKTRQATKPSALIVRETRRWLQQTRNGARTAEEQFCACDECRCRLGDAPASRAGMRLLLRQPLGPSQPQALLKPLRTPAVLPLHPHVAALARRPESSPARSRAYEDFKAAS